MKRFVRAGALLGAMASLAGCESAASGPPFPQRNYQIGATPPVYTWEALPPSNLPGTLVIVTASGGGSRAAALALGVLNGMKAVQISRTGTTLADEIDVISSVSGGSVTAAYLALNGTDGLDRFKKDFLAAPNMREQLGVLLRPDQVLRLWSPLNERIDVLIDHLDDKIYSKKTFADLAGRPKRPYLILNGADLAEGVPFAFTQPNLNLLCSDLSKMKIATAVAASAAFPVAYNPVTLRNYNPSRDKPRDPACPQDKAILSGAGAAYTNIDPPEARRRHIARAYENGTKEFVHIIDGGVADNLGIHEPYRLLTRDDASPSFRRQIAEGRLTQLIVISINARTQGDTDDLDTRQAPPSELLVANKTIGGIRGGAANATMDGLRTLLTDRIRVMALDAPTQRQAANFRRVAANTAFITVDLETLPMERIYDSAGRKKSCRQLFNEVPTSWQLSEERRDGVVALGEALFVGHPEFEKARRMVGGELTPAGAAMTVDRACTVVAADPERAARN